MQMIPTIKEQLNDVINQLAPHDQEKLLVFARALTLPEGISGKDLITFFEQYPLTEEDIAQMRETLAEIEE